MKAMGCDWELISAFDSLAEYDRFQQWINDQVAAGAAASVPVRRPYSGSQLWDERWFECLNDHRIWRLVRPDPPFRGVFKPVK